VPKTGRFLIGTVAGFKSEWWPVFDRNGGRLHVGIRTKLIPDHIAPERLYLETRWASLVPYAAAADLMADVLPIDSGINAMTVRQHAMRTAERLERELTEDRVSFMEDSCPRDWGPCLFRTAAWSWGSTAGMCVTGATGSETSK
jgi:hypothetical protein